MTKAQHYNDTPHQAFSLTANGQGQVIDIDADGQDMLGYRTEDLDSGLDFLDLFATDDRQRTNDNIRRILKGQRLGLIRYTMVAKSGRPFSVLMNCYKAETADGLQCNIFLIPQNFKFADWMSEHRHIFQLVFEAIPNGMCIVDALGIITHWNCAAEQLTGITSKQAVGQKGDSIFNCHEYGKQCPLRHKKKGPAAPLCNNVVIYNKGRPTHLQKTVNFFHAPNGTISGAIESFVDQTSQFEAEAALNEARELMESARTAKRHFLANMNHEIRTPLNGIIGLIDLLLNDQPTASQRDNLNVAKRSALLLLDLFDNILDFTVVDKKAIHIEFSGFSLSSIISSVISRQFDLKQNQALAIHSHIDADVPDNLVGDAGRLYQILKQLVNNAIKFTPSGEVAIGVTRTPHNPSASQGDARRMMLHFSITDTGVGIAEKQLDSIFEAMTQADESSTRAFGGLGIGLTRVHRLVDLLDGRIWIESKPKQGTTVHLVLPFKNAAAGDEPAPEHTGNPPHAGKGIHMGSHPKHLKLAPLPLTDRWRAQFKHLESELFSDAAQTEYSIKQLKIQAEQANQKSIEKILFRLLLAVRRGNREDIHNYYFMLAQKIASGEDAGAIISLEGGPNENTDRRR